jgi:AAA domain
VTEHEQPGLYEAVQAAARGDLKTIVDAWQSNGTAGGLLERLYGQLAGEVLREDLEAERLAATRGPRLKRTAAEYAKIPPPPAIITNALAAEVNLLGGPQEAGKSLLARDWTLHIASGVSWGGYTVSERRKVLVVLSEGTHDFAERWATQPLWNHAAEWIYILDEPVDLVHGDDVDWLLKEYADERPGLVVFDVIYGMGMRDDNGVKDVLPVLSSLKRISAEWGAATLALGHPGHNGDRRFRGSSSWRQLAAVEWFMGDGQLSCEKSKLADRRRLGGPYVPAYPNLRWLSSQEATERLGERAIVVQADIERYPDDNVADRARRLAPLFEVSERTARRYVEAVTAGRVTT